MNQDAILPSIRKGLKRKLHAWMPSNSDLVEQELEIYDAYLSRRDFLKVASVSAMAACVLHGEDNETFNGPPSQWNVGDKKSAIPRSAQLQVSQATNIIVDADMVDSVQQYNPIDAKGPVIIGDTVIESFNPHIMTVDIETDQTRTINRTFGIPEIVQLKKNNSASDYVLCTFTNSDDKTSGLEYQEKWLEGTSAFNYGRLVGANGNYHNKIKDGLVYNQKLYLLAETEKSVFNDTLGSIYYQAYTHALLAPGMEFDESTLSADAKAWKQIDLMTLFYQVETYAYDERYILEVDRYADGEQNSFLYGTIMCDRDFFYGFVITFDDFSLTPKVRFFHLYFQSTFYAAYRNYMSNMYTQLNSEEGIWIWSEYFFGCFNRTFVPIAVNGTDIIFRYVIIEGFEGLHWPSVNDSGMGPYKSTFLFNVSTAGTAANQLLRLFNDGSTPRYEYDNNGKYFTVKVAGYIPGLQNFRNYLDGTMQIGTKRNITYTRFMRHESNGDLSLIVNYPEAPSAIIFDLQITYKAFSLKRVGGGYQKSETLPYTSGSYPLSTATVDTKHYRELWFDQVKGQIDSVNTLSNIGDMIRITGSGLYNFQMMHNPNGLLRCHFLIGENKALRIDQYHADGKTMLVAFNEAGTAHTFESLLAVIVPGAWGFIQNSTLFYPPAPIAFDAFKINHMPATAQDSEVIYTAKRLRIQDTAAKRLVPNSAGAEVYSYFHAISEPIEGRWNLSELETNSAAGTNIYIDKRHRINLAITNIYGAPTTLGEDVYVELRFDTPLKLFDKTNPLAPKHYYVNSRQVSIFAKPGVGGKLTLEADLGGSRNKLYRGATMSYRLIKKSDLKLVDGSPVAALSSLSDSTTGFKACNISFAAFDRLSGTQHPMLATNDIETKLSSGTTLDTTQRSKTLEAYGAMRDAARPKNSTPLVGARSLYQTKLSRRGVRSITLRSDTFVYYDPLTSVLVFGSTSNRLTRGAFDWVTDAWNIVTDAIDNAIDTLVDGAAAAKALLEAIKTKAMEFFNAVLDTASAIGSATLSIIDAAAALASGLYHSLTEAISGAFSSVVDWLKDVIEAIFGYLNTCYNVGTEIKQLLIDQLKSSTTYPNNIYGRMSGVTSEIQGTMNSVFSYLKDQSTIEANGLFKFENIAPQNIQQIMVSAQTKIAEGVGKGKVLTDTLMAGSTHLNHVTELSKTLFSTMSSTPDHYPDTPQTCDSTLTIEELIKCSATNIHNNIMDGFEETLKDASTLAETFLAFGSTNGPTAGDLALQYKKVFKTAYDHAITTPELIIDTIAMVPTAILNGSSTMDTIKSALDTAAKSALELVGLALFLDKNKFKTVDDLTYFIMGFTIQNGLAITGELYKAINPNMDKDQFVNYIANGTMRSDMNTVLNTFDQAPKLRPSGWEIAYNSIQSTLGVIDTILSYVNVFNSLADYDIDIAPDAATATALKANPLYKFLKVSDFLISQYRVLVGLWNVITAPTYLALKDNSETAKWVIGFEWVNFGIDTVLAVVDSVLTIADLLGISETVSAVSHLVLSALKLMQNILNFILGIINSALYGIEEGLEDILVSIAKFIQNVIDMFATGCNMVYKHDNEPISKAIFGGAWAVLAVASAGMNVVVLGEEITFQIIDVATGD